MNALLKRVESAVEKTMVPVVGQDVFGAFRACEHLYCDTLNMIAGDALAYEQKDPASRGNIDLIIDVYQTFRAVMLYRISHALMMFDLSCSEDTRKAAHQLSSTARLASGIDIHPAANIGVGFVIDHGWGTVIGETAVIGRDCYFLECVTLGARGISNNPNGKRHPTIGNRVEIGGHAKILGNVRIGDDCFIAPHAVVTENVPRNSQVIITNQLQVTRRTFGATMKLVVPGVIRMNNDIIIQTTGVTRPEVYVVNDECRKMETLQICQVCDHGKVIFCISPDYGVADKASSAHLLLEDCGRAVLIKDLHRLFRPVVDPCATSQNAATFLVRNNA